MLRNQKRPGSGQLKSTGAVPGASRMSALGQKRTCAAQYGMSALPPKADMCGATRDVRFVPIADIAHPSRDSALLGGTGGLVHWLDRQNDLE